jgi:hypothetical protein
MLSPPWTACWRPLLWRAIPTLAFAPNLAAHAQAPASPYLDPGPTLRASQANTPVPAQLYRSALAGLPKGVERGPLDWTAANAAVAQFPRGHADLLKWEQAQRATPPQKEAQP